MFCIDISFVSFDIASKEGHHFGKQTDLFNKRIILNLISLFALLKKAARTSPMCTHSHADIVASTIRLTRTDRKTCRYIPPSGLSIVDAALCRVRWQRETPRR